MPPRLLYHYTDEAGLSAILASGVLLASTASRNPRDIRHGEGQYLTDLAPGELSPARLSRRLLGHPFAGHRFTHFPSIVTTGLDVRAGRDRIFVVPGSNPLPLAGRIVASGPVPVLMQS
jgi:hypothetical protein